MVTTYFRNLVADNVWHTAGATSLPETYWLALSSTEPLEDGTGVTEPSAAAGYARTQMQGLTAAVDGAVNNGAIISWPKMATADGAVEFWALYDAQTGGNLLMGDPLDSLKHLDAGTSISVEVNGLTLNVLGD